MTRTARVRRTALMTSFLLCMVLPLSGSSAGAAEGPDTGLADWTAVEERWCARCGAVETFYIYASPDGSRRGEDVAPTGSQWTMTLCLNCGAVNGDLPAEDGAFDHVCFRLEDCPAEHHLEDIAYTPVDGDLHRMTAVDVARCPQCGRTWQAPAEELEPHEYAVETGADGYARYTCVRCGYSYEEAGTPAPAPAEDPEGVSAPRTVAHPAYVAGLPDGTFAPDRPMSRAEAAGMLGRLLPDGANAAGETFPDVPPDAWYAPAVDRLAAAGVVRGEDGGRFAPERPVTRGEFTALLVRLLTAGTAGGGAPAFSDVPADHWAAADIRAAATLGWALGDGAGRFRPDDPVTRAEAVVLLGRALGRQADRSYIDAHLGGLKTFPDVGPDHWARYPILEAANSHDAQAGTPEIWSR